MLSWNQRSPRGTATNPLVIFALLELDFLHHTSNASRTPMSSLPLSLPSARSLGPICSREDLQSKGSSFIESFSSGCLAGCCTNDATELHSHQCRSGCNSSPAGICLILFDLSLRYLGNTFSELFLESLFIYFIQTPRGPTRKLTRQSKRRND